jgi:hypothetical protein
VLIRLVPVFGSLIRISGLFSGHIAGIEVVLWVLAGLLAACIK